MFGSDSNTDHKHHLSLHKMGDFLGDEFTKAKLKFEHALGLGHQPNVIPAAEAELNGEYRTVEVGWHPVAGLAGKWFAEKTGLGKMITEHVHKYPDPTQHWAIIVGDYCHQLWMDENLDIIYINEKLKRDEWHTYEVGKTRYNDEALRQAGELVIWEMREKKPGYNLINNNCQNFATFMLDSIQVGAHKAFATALTVYQRATGVHKVSDLFIDNLLQENPEDLPTEDKPESAVKRAHEVMDENTTKLDKHHDLH